MAKKTGFEAGLVVLSAHSNSIALLPQIKHLLNYIAPFQKALCKPMGEI